MEHVVYHSPCIGVIRSNGESGLEGSDELSPPSLVTVVSISMKLSRFVEGDQDGRGWSIAQKVFHEHACYCFHVYTKRMTPPVWEVCR
jgi:hypothetical protein